MLALEPLIADRLRALSALAGWAVRQGSDDIDRRAVPAVDVRLLGAGVPQVRRVAATFAPEWAVTLVTRRGSAAAGELDAALQAVIAGLHNWMPPATSGQQWTELQARRLAPADFADAALVGYELAFTTASVYQGQA